MWQSAKASALWRAITGVRQKLMTQLIFAPMSKPMDELSKSYETLLRRLLFKRGTCQRPDISGLTPDFVGPGAGEHEGSCPSRLDGQGIRTEQGSRRKDIMCPRISDFVATAPT
jgi:hypothetical protein